MVVDKLVLAKLPQELKIFSATLLTMEEANTFLTQDSRKYKKHWWLKDPGCFNYSASGVDAKGNVTEVGFLVAKNTDICLRPALRISIINTNFEIGDIFMFGGKEFKIISNNLAFMYHSDIGICAFNSEYKPPYKTNNYKISDIKKIVEEWFNNASEGNSAALNINHSQTTEGMLKEYAKRREPKKDNYKINPKNVQNKKRR